MCRFASGIFKPDTMEVRIADLNSHSETQKAFGLTSSSDGDTPDGWREFHWLPSLARPECRVLPQDSCTARECASAMVVRWPKFMDFLQWCLQQPTYMGGSLYLRGCDLKGVKLPEKMGGSLDLSGCDLKGVKLPEKMGGSLYLRGDRPMSLEEAKKMISG